MSVLYSPLPVSERTDITESVSSPSPNQATKYNKEVSATPLLNTSAPIAITEFDDDLDHTPVDTPYPGIDDGFFPNNDEHPDVETIDPKNHKNPDPEVEIIPPRPKDPEALEPPDNIPDLTPRNGSGNDPDDFDGRNHVPDKPPGTPRRKPSFPFVPGYGFPSGHDFEVGSLPGDPDISLPDVNVYQHKKTLAQGMMDLALFSANANQLRYVLESFNRHPYYFASLGLISVSLILQV
ncbi:hypothetical protein NQ315_004815 [Exocentrus adspersus]|uniref:Uncharacterized protein n=1 Tax=Exocentrus adspersus TaxID=1586481 RepID=A0AAV8W3H7_9CUCU|nr:hypothetical protein NQ315_004815 [Exocentrus adspersus]